MSPPYSTTGSEQGDSEDSDEMWLDEHSLSDADQKAVLGFAMRHTLTLSNIQYKGVPRFMRYPPFPSIKHCRTRLSKLSGIHPVRFDCCVNVCCCFTGAYADLTHCPICNTSRLRSDGRPRKQFAYLPCKDRLRSLFASRRTAELMRYRARQSKQHDGTSRDYTDGLHYRSLCQQRVVIDGKEQTFCYFSGDHDVALALSADGVCPFKNRRVTCWPLLLINLSLPPDERYKSHNVISLGIIPGPKQPKDLDSFLWAFYSEMLEFAAGVETFDILDDAAIDLHAYLIMVFGDLQAIAKLLRMKGVNGHCPCRFCSIIAIPDPESTSKTCYVPHDRRGFAGQASYDPAHLPLRTHDDMMRTAAAVDSATPGDQRRLARDTGIKGTALLARLPGISLPHSFPCEFMHLVWIDLIPLLVALYSTDFKGLGEGSGEYRLTPLAWEHIGEAAKAAGNTIPSAFGRRVPDLAEERGYRTAETWSVWTLYVAPATLKGRFRRNRYYNHFMDLARLASLCINLEVSPQDRSAIRLGFIKWVKQFEEYFYQYDPSRVSMCTSIIHYLLHVPDSIEYQGPSWVYWAFVMERHCGRIARATRSRQHPWASVTNFVLAEAQLETVKCLYNLDETFFLGPGTVNSPPGQVLRLPDYPTCELVAPSKMVKIDHYLAVQLANVLSVWFAESSDPTTCGKIRRCLPADIQVWGKVRRLDGGDMMHAVDMVPHQKRDMTFVRYEQMVDKNRHHAHQRSEFKRQKFYGQLRRIFVLELSAKLAVLLRLQAPRTIAIAAVSECTDLSAPNEHGLQFFSNIKTSSELLELRTIECVVGRVQAHDGRWAVVDRSDGLSRVLFTGGEDPEDNTVEELVS